MAKYLQVFYLCKLIWSSGHYKIGTIIIPIFQIRN